MRYYVMQTPALSEHQQQVVWDNWLSAEIRAAYFAELVQKFQAQQRYLVLGSLLLSSGATITLLTTIVPPTLAWIRPLLTVLAAGLSLWSLVAKNERGAIDCADLHLRWSTLALGYETLWGDMYSDDAAGKLQALRQDEIALSKTSTSQPTYENLLEKAQRNVVMHHREMAA